MRKIQNKTLNNNIIMKYYYLNEWFEISSDRETVKNQYIYLLSQLSTVDYMSVEMFEDSIKKISKMGDIIVCIDDQTILGSNPIVGTGTIIYEPKILHGGKYVGHIEDIVVDEPHRGHEIASEIIKKLVESAKTHNCYKVILNCSEFMEKYYERRGFTKNGAEMAIYFQAQK
jgi:glucosamine-phosphate N-acetyltransferase